MSEKMEVVLVGGHEAETDLIGPITRKGCLPGMDPNLTQDLMESLGIQSIRVGEKFIHLEDSRIPSAKAAADKAIAAELRADKLREFKTDPAWWRLTLWGGGHTSETLPTNRGWRAAKAGGPDVVLVGRKGVKGCFSARPFGEGRLDVAVYGESPEEVVSAWKAREYLDPIYKTVEHVPGWALPFVRELEGAK